MALPVAQLGYMPNMNLPTSRQRYEVRNPWEDLAQAVLTNLATQAAGNVMSRDYTAQATDEGLLGDRATTTIGPMESMETGEQYGQPVTQSAAPDQQNAGFFEKLVQGPKTSGPQIQQLRQQGNERMMQSKGIEAGVESQKRDILSRADRDRFMAEQSRQAAEAERGFRATQADLDRGLTSRGLDINQQATDDRFKLGKASIEADMTQPQRDPAAAQAAVVFREVMAQASTARAIQNAQRIQSGQPLLPEVSPEEAAQLYNKILQTIQAQYGQRPAITAPEVPLVGR